MGTIGGESVLLRWFYFISAVITVVMKKGLKRVPFLLCQIAGFFVEVCSG
jgi:hypothetical protein